MVHIRKDPPSAHWMHPDKLKGEEYTFDTGMILLGEDKEGRLIGYDDNRHLVTVAGSRAGKTATSLMSNLRTWPGSVMAIDPKGELATNTALARKSMGHDVFILDPFGEVKDARLQSMRVGYDPLEEIRQGNPDDAIDNAALIAEAMIVSGKDKPDHWELSAKNMIRGMILNALAYEARLSDPATLPLVREWITLPYEIDDDDDEDNDAPTLRTMFEMMGKSDAFGGAVAGVGGTMIGKPPNERGSIISTAVEQTSFIDSIPMQRHLSSNGLGTLRQLKRKPTTIYLVLPASRMATHFRWLRMILTLAMACLENEDMAEGMDHDALFILEEFPQLGYMRQIEAAAGLMAGYRVKLWTVMQDLSQLKALYPQSWETFLGNAGIVEAFGNTDATTTEYLSRRLGMTLSKITQTDNLNLSQQQQGANPEREQIQTAPLLAPFEVAKNFARDENRKLVLIAGKDPFHIRRLYWEDDRLDQYSRRQ